MININNTHPQEQGCEALDFIPNEAYEKNLARRGDDGDSVNDENYEKTGEMLRAILPIACSRCLEKMKTKGLYGLWHCWFVNEARKAGERMLSIFDDRNEVEVPY